jgi:hypothetical protein
VRILSRQVIPYPESFLLLADYMVDQHRSSRLAPFHSQTRPQTSAFHSTMLRSHQSLLRLHPKSSNSLSTPLLIFSRSERYNPSGIWISSNLAASLGKSPISISGNNMPGCRSGSKTCRRARFPPLRRSSSSNFYTVMFTSSRQARGYPTSTSMRNGSSSNIASPMLPICSPYWRSRHTRSNRPSPSMTPCVRT